MLIGDRAWNKQTGLESCIRNSTRWESFVFVGFTDPFNLESAAILNSEKHSLFFNSKAISWTLYNLARFPEHQQKCRQEIEEVFGETKEFEWLVLMWSFQLSYRTYWVTCPVLRRQCSARSVPFRSRGPSEFVRASPRRSISTKKAWEGASWPGICTWLNGFREGWRRGSGPLL